MDCRGWQGHRLIASRFHDYPLRIHGLQAVSADWDNLITRVENGTSPGRTSTVIRLRQVAF